MEKVLELVQLSNGDIELRDTQSDEQSALMTVSFSGEVNTLLQNNKLDIARAMLEAGIKRQNELLSAQYRQLQESKHSNLLH
ncbi:MAG: hypothetical protein KTR16_09605 [Acidiferrobacterales bacterium]|nr:hypothetical protein [Acidiferrobacterales bacterium]